MTLRVIVADDELLARKRMRRLVGAISNVVLVDVVESAEGLFAALAQQSVDVVLLDIRMPGLDGIDAAALLPDPAPRVIFVTAHADRALDAFERGAVDYIVKPVDPARLREALSRIQHRTSHSRLPVETSDGVVLVDPSTISHLSFDGALVSIYRLDAPTLMSDRSLSELAERLPRHFERVHRRHLVNLDQVDRLVPTEARGYRALIGEFEVPVSRQAARRLRTLLDIG